MVRLYFVALVLPKAINGEILGFKNYMLENFGCRVGLRSPAHITLIPPFNMEQREEEQLVRHLENAARSLSPFQIDAEGFSHFGERTIFVSVASNTALDQCYKELGKYFVAHSLPIKKETRPFHPHITIANRDIKPADFNIAWERFRSMSFERSWVCDSVSLLKYNGQNWDVIGVAGF